MIAPEDCVLVLLAAGRSQRFGAADKLAADLDGKPVGMHVIDTLAGVRFAERVAVVGGGALDYAAYGFHVVRNADPGRGLSSSIRLGVTVAKERNAAAVLIALADMPRVSAALIGRLLDAADGDDAVVVSIDGTRPSPPAVFGSDHYDHLLTLQGDAGARQLVAKGLRVAAGPAELADIDTPEELADLQSSPSSAWGGGPPP